MLWIFRVNVLPTLAYFFPSCMLYKRKIANPVQINLSIIAHTLQKELRVKFSSEYLRIKTARKI
jgi:hypothetical protein